ncbi:ATP-binding cassette domain-containing protein, partial [Rhizobium ruizarguesonis]
SVRNLGKIYGWHGKSNTLRAVDDASFDLYPGENLGIVGESGSGKTTLGKMLVGSIVPTSGNVRLDLMDLRNWDQRQFGESIGYLPQEPKLNPEHTVREAVEEAVAEVKNALTRLDEVYALYADPDADFDKLAKEQGELEAIIQI